MQIELEKKYKLTKQDYKTIREKCEFIKDVELKDYYLDKDLILSKNEYYLRIRNWEYELKIISFNPETKLATWEEYVWEEEINNVIKKFNLTIDELTWIMFVDTKREKYKYNYKWQEIIIDVEEYQYWNRYEIEIVYNENNESESRTIIKTRLNNLIEDFRQEIGLVSDLTSRWESKLTTTAMYQNIELYEIYMSNEK